MLDQETKRRINSARDILVGKVPDPKSQIEQITNALIYKFMDDMDRESEGLGGNPSFLTGELAEFAWGKLMDKKLSGDERWNRYSRALESFAKSAQLPELFRTIFKSAYLPFRDSQTLNLFLKEISNFKYEHSEKLGDAFEYLLSILGSQGDAGQFRTPRHIIDFIVEVVAPQKNETILDPACGTAGFLISAYKYIKKYNSDDFDEKKAYLPFVHITSDDVNSLSIQSNGKYKGEKLTPGDKNKLAKNITGYDIAPEMTRLSLVNLYLHGFAEPKITEYDTLTSDEKWDENFDVILANPPFMTPKGGIYPHNKFAVSANRAEVLFVDYIAEHLSIKGRAGIIVPEGIISQIANSYKSLRKNLIENWGLYAVVSLPKGVFNPYSGVKTSILFIDKQLAKKTKDFLFIKVANDGFGLGAQRRKIDKNDLGEAFKLLKEWQETQTIAESKIAHSVSKEKISENGEYNLTDSSYRETIDYSNAKWEMVELGEILEYEQPTNYIVESTNYSDNYKTPVLTAGKSFLLGYTNETLGVFLKKNLPVIIFDDFTTAIKFVDFTFKVKSSAMKILKANDKINIKFVFYMMKKIKFEPSQHKRYWISQYSKIKIPLPPLEIQEQILAEIEQYQKVIDGAKQVVQNYKPSFRIDPDWQIVELGEICEIQRGTSITKKDLIKGNIPVIAGGQQPAYYHNQANRNENVITVSGSGAYAGFVNYFSNPIFASDCSTIQSLNKKESSILFVFYILKGKQDIIYKLQSGMGQPHVYAKDLKKLKIPLPPLEIQEQIVAEIESEQKAVDECKNLIAKMETKIKSKISELWQDKPNNKSKL